MQPSGGGREGLPVASGHSTQWPRKRSLATRPPDLLTRPLRAPALLGSRGCCLRPCGCTQAPLGLHYLLRPWAATPLPCSGRGSCRNGTCECPPEFGGMACEVDLCPHDCSQRGSCLTGKAAAAHFAALSDASDGTGPTSIVATAAASLLSPQAGTHPRAVCVCDEGHTGTDCSLRGCPANCSGVGHVRGVALEHVGVCALMAAHGLHAHTTALHAHGLHAHRPACTPPCMHTARRRCLVRLATPAHATNMGRITRRLAVFAVARLPLPLPTWPWRRRLLGSVPGGVRRPPWPVCRRALLVLGRMEWTRLRPAGVRQGVQQSRHLHAGRLPLRPGLGRAGLRSEELRAWMLRRPRSGHVLRWPMRVRRGLLGTRLQRHMWRRGWCGVLGPRFLWPWTHVRV